VSDYVQLTVVGAIEETPTAAFLATKRMIPVEGKEGARADAAITDEGTVAKVSRVDP
jgi:hypothetical protein